MSYPVPPSRHVSTWTRREQLMRLLWGFTQATLFKYSFHNFYGFRAALLRMFGAKIGSNARIRRTVKVEIPWHLNLGDDITIGDHAILYALGTITLGHGTFISQYAHLCAGTHDYTRLDYPLLRHPITIGEHCWIAADTFVGPNVTIGDGTVVGARSSVFSNLPAWVVAVGSPAKPIKPRVMKDTSPALTDNAGTPTT